MQSNERQLVEPLPEFVGGAGKTIDDKNAKGAVLPQNDDAGAGPDTGKTTDFITLADGTKARRQPLATRHLDPNEHGWNPDSATSQSAEDRGRFKVRKGFVFLYGKRLAYQGPCFLWLTAEEVKGQEHKVEEMSADPIRITKPENAALPAIAENRTVRELEKKLAIMAGDFNILKGELQIAKREEAARAERLGGRGALIDTPQVNLAAEGVPPEALQEGGPESEPRQEVTGDGDESALQEHNPADDAHEMETGQPRRGRPPGSKDKAPRRRASLVDTPGGVNPADKG